MTSDDGALRADFEAIRGKRIFFGHQSVGVDIMQGIMDLHAASPELGLNFVALHDSGKGKPAKAGSPYFADALVGKNSEPNSKCDAFGNVVGRLAEDSLDIALLKFCYVDIKPETDVAAMFRYYAGTMDDLRRRYPGVTFVHVTVPVTERTSAWKRFAKKILGRTDVWEIGGIKRAQFNEMLLEHYRGEPVFDLARVESTYPDGSRNTFEANGKPVAMLVSEYTRDGGHLNEYGRRIVARELVRTLARTVRETTPQ